MLGGDPGRALGGGRSPLLPAQRDWAPNVCGAAACSPGFAHPSPAPAALCPSCLLNFCLNPSGSLPSGNFQDVASSTLNFLRHFQRQESDPRLLYGPWERGCCVIEAHTRVGLHGGCGDTTCLGQATLQASRFSIKSLFLPNSEAAGLFLSLQVGRGVLTTAAALRCVFEAVWGTVLL